MTVFLDQRIPSTESYIIHNLKGLFPVRLKMGMFVNLPPCTSIKREILMTIKVSSVGFKRLQLSHGLTREESS